MTDSPAHAPRESEPERTPTPVADAWGVQTDKLPTRPVPVPGRAFTDSTAEVPSSAPLRRTAQPDAWGPQSRPGPAPVPGRVTGAAPSSGVIRRDLVDALQYLPSAPEWLKEKIDPRRSTLNPYWSSHNEQEKQAEKDLPTYHSTSRHGAANTLENLHGRTQKGTAGTKEKSGMTNLLTGAKDVPKSASSSRFATPAWHVYALNVAKKQFEQQSGAAGVQWPKTGDPKTPKFKAAGTHNASFWVTFEGTSVGLSSKAADDAESISSVRVAVNYTKDAKTGQADYAIIGQFFPEKTPGAASAGFKNVQIPYAQIPWFSTDA